MENKPDGGPAFPAEIHTTVMMGTMTGGKIEHLPGMSLRDYFAAKALAAWIGKGAIAELLNEAGTLEAAMDRLAQGCYRVADVMLAERAK